MSVYQTMLERYESGDLPWNDELPPPEVIDFVETLSGGRALDLGCGAGRSSIYLASLGWDVDGVDFIPKAIEMAKEAAAKAEVSPRFHVGSVAELDFLTEQIDLAVDVGCMHSLQGDDLLGYAQGIRRLLRVGGKYLLFARLKADATPSEDSPSGIDESALLVLFDEGFTLDKSVGGSTEAGDGTVWESGWFWFTRVG